MKISFLARLAVTVKDPIDDGQNEQCEHGAGNDAADDNSRKRALNFCAAPVREGHRQEAQ